MALLAISLPTDQTAREMIALLEVIQRELLPSPDDACLVTRDAAGEVRVRQSVSVTPRGAGGTFWITLVQRILEIRERQVDQGADAMRGTLRPGSSTLFVITRNGRTLDRVVALANAIGGRVLHMQLSRQTELALNLASLMPSAA